MRQLTKSIALAGVALMAAATAGPAVADSLQLLTFIPVPADTTVNPGGAFAAFDTAFADSVTGDIFVADRSNASVDIFSGSSLTFLGRATGFSGQQTLNALSGPNGVLTVTSGGVTSLYAGNGNSTMRVYDATSPASPSFVGAVSTGGNFRLDTIAYSPMTGQLLTVNNADSPAFANLIQTTNGQPPLGIPSSKIFIPGAPSFSGMEQPAWNPTTNTFFVSMPVLTTSGGDPGGIAEINTNGTVVNTISFTNLGISSCAPTGLAVGGSGNLMVGCGNFGTQAIMLTPTGMIIRTFTNISGTDQVWYDPTTKAFYVTGRDAAGNQIFDVITDNGASSIITQTVVLPTTTLAHSITVDPFTGDVFVPFAGTLANDPCPSTFANPGCIAVFGEAETAVPLPATFPLFATGLGGLGLLGWRRKRKTQAVA